MSDADLQSAIKNFKSMQSEDERSANAPRDNPFPSLEYGTVAPSSLLAPKVSGPKLKKNGSKRLSPNGKQRSASPHHVESDSLQYVEQSQLVYGMQVTEADSLRKSAIKRLEMKVPTNTAVSNVVETRTIWKLEFVVAGLVSAFYIRSLRGHKNWVVGRLCDNVWIHRVRARLQTLASLLCKKQVHTVSTAFWCVRSYARHERRYLITAKRAVADEYSISMPTRPVQASGFTRTVDSRVRLNRMASTLYAFHTRSAFHSLREQIASCNNMTREPLRSLRMLSKDSENHRVGNAHPTAKSNHTSLPSLQERELELVATRYLRYLS